MGQRLAHVAHRQRLADRGFYQAGDETIVNGPPFLLDPNLSDERSRLGEGRRLAMRIQHARCTQTARQELCWHLASGLNLELHDTRRLTGDQKACLTRTSSA